MNKLLVLFLSCISFTLNSQNRLIEGLDDGFQQSCQDESLYFETPLMPYTGCSTDDYSCGYRQGVKAAMKMISRLSPEQKEYNRRVNKYRIEYQKNYDEYVKKREEEEIVKRYNDVIQTEYERTKKNLINGPQGYPMLDAVYRSKVVIPAELKGEKGPDFKAHISPLGDNAFLTYVDEKTGKEYRLRWEWGDPNVYYQAAIIDGWDVNEDANVYIFVSSDRKTIFIKGFFDGQYKKLQLNY